MSGVRKESRNDSVAGSSTMMEPTMMEEGEEYFNTEEPSAEWTEPTACSQLCRMCATENEYLIPIFDGEGVEHQLGMKIEKHLPIRVHVDDTLPLQVCYQCASTLIAWHDLVVGCIEAEKKLRQLQHQGEPQEEDIEDVKTCDTAMFYEDPTGTEPANDPIDTEPSTSASTHVQIRLPPKKTVPKANPKLKMVIVKTPTPATVTAPTARMVTPKTEGALDTTERPSRPKSPSSAASTLACRLSTDGSTKFVCHICYRLFDSEEEFDVHMSDGHHELILGDEEEDEEVDGVPEESLPASQPDDARYKGIKNRLLNPKHPRRFSCELCDMAFTRKQDMQKHRRKHDTLWRTADGVAWDPTGGAGGRPGAPRRQFKLPRRFACDACDKRFVRRFNMLQHRVRAHGGARVDPGLQAFMCDVCGEVTTDALELATHRHDQHGVDVDSAALAPVDTIAATEADTGFRPLFPCDVCGSTFFESGAMLSHRRTAHPEEPDLAEPEPENDEADVDRSAPAPSRLGRKPPAAFACDACEASFTRAHDLQRHVRHVHGQDDDVATVQLIGRKTLRLRPYKARVRKVYDGEELAQIERATTCVDGKKFYRCDVCLQHLRTKYSFVNHRRCHTGEKPFTCHVCGRSFRTAEQMARHVSDVHDKIKKHACPICGRAFATITTRNEHVFTHSQERTFVCHVCGKAFRSNGTLRVHYKFHSNEFPFHCSLCDKKFRMRQNYANHFRVHTGEKPHACAQCGKSFRTDSELKNHTLTHTSTEKFECAPCKKQYAQKRYLRNHLRLSHGVRKALPAETG